MGKFKRFFGSTSFKRGSFTTLFTILFLVVVILLNVLCSALSARFPLNLDLTAGKDFSMNEENRPYISEIDTDIDILLLSTEDYYVNTYYLALEQQGTIEQQEENQRYFQQTVEILKTYQKINPRIHLTFIDPSTPAASDFVNKYYGEMTPTLGDLVVANREKVDNGEANGIRVLAFSGLYSLTDETGYASQGYGAYTIAGSNVEEKVDSVDGTIIEDRTGWKYTANGTDYSEDMFDGDLKDGWTVFTDETPEVKVEVDMASVRTIVGWRMGFIDYLFKQLRDVAVSVDGQKWESQASGDVELALTEGNWRYLQLRSPVECRYIRMTIIPYSWAYNSCEFEAYAPKN